MKSHFVNAIAVICTVLFTFFICLLLSATTLFDRSETNEVNEKAEAVTEVRVVAFVSSWCGPCREAYPFLLHIQSTGVDVQIIDIDKNPGLARKYGVRGVPAFFVYVKGKRHQTQSIVRVWQLCITRGR